MTVPDDGADASANEVVESAAHDVERNTIARRNDA